MAQTTKQYLAKLTQRLKQVREIKNYQLIFSTLLGRQITRIFDNGLNCKVRKIGEYSTRPMLVGRKSFHRKSDSAKLFGSLQKRRAQKWVTLVTSTGNHRLVVLDGGYKELRELQGMKSDRVVLHYTQDFRIDFSNSLQRKGQSFFTGVKRASNGRKLDALVEKYDPCTFKHTKREVNDLKVEIHKRTIQLLAA